MTTFGHRRQGITFFRQALLAAALAMLPASASVDYFEQKHHAAVLENPPGVDFTIRFSEDRRVFRQGDAIGIELEFSSQLEQTYELDTANYDRSGRLWIDGFVMDPKDGWADPLDDYFYGFYEVGGLRGMPELEPEPIRFTYELNEWYRFDRPGTYRFFVVSGRLSHVRALRDESEGWSLPVTSNILQFEIVAAEPEWTEEQGQQAIHVLDSGGTKEEKEAAARTLRFIGSELAVKEMARRFRGEEDDFDWEYKFGLFGSPHRSLVISEMEKLLEDPNHPVTDMFLNTLADLVTFRDHPELLRPYSSWQEMGDQAERRRELSRQLAQQYAARAARSRPPQ